MLRLLRTTLEKRRQNFGAGKICLFANKDKNQNIDQGRF
jgi:hypothetical protein